MAAPTAAELRREFLLDPIRLSLAAYTTREEVDRLLAALVRELDAEHGQ